MDWHCSPFVIPAEERRSRSKSRDKGLTASILGHCVGVKGHTSQRAARLSRLAPFGLGRDDKLRGSRRPGAPRCGRDDKRVVEEGVSLFPLWPG